MILTTQLQLTITSHDVKNSLLDTLETANSACNLLSKLVFSQSCFSRNKLHELSYQTLRSAPFNLHSQLACRCIAKVTHAYKSTRASIRESNKIRRKKNLPLLELQQITFSKWGAIPFDDRNLSFKKDSISISTLHGRQKVNFASGEKQLHLLQSRKGESDLFYRDGKFFLAVCCEIPEPDITESTGFLGIDRGINNIAVDNDGKFYGNGKYLKRVRFHYAKVRAELQSKKTKSAKRRLKARRRKENRFATNTNHVISKQIVQKAKRTKRTVVLENLSGIRQRVRVKKAVRELVHKWAFRQLGDFIEYKARLAGVEVIYVDPAYSSQTCPKCSHCEKANRVGSRFGCRECGFVGHSDKVGAINIGRRGSVTIPLCGTLERS